MTKPMNRDRQIPFMYVLLPVVGTSICVHLNDGSCGDEAETDAKTNMLTLTI